MSEEIRQPKMILLIGTNGTGKTTFAKKLVKSELEKSEGRALIVTPHDMEWTNIPLVHDKFKNHIENYVKARRIIFEGPDDLNFIRQYFSDGMLVFDDCRAYLKSSLDTDLHGLLISRRQKMLDIVAVGHGFTEIPPKFFTFATHIVLFRTTDNIDRRKEVIRDFETMQQAQIRVNQQSQQNPYYNEVIQVI